MIVLLNIMAAIGIIMNIFVIIIIVKRTKEFYIKENIIWSVFTITNLTFIGIYIWRILF